MSGDVSYVCVPSSGGSAYAEENGPACVCESAMAPAAIASTAPARMVGTAICNRAAVRYDGLMVVEYGSVVFNTFAGSNGNVVSGNHVAPHFGCQPLMSSSIQFGLCILVSSSAFLLRKAINGVSLLSISRSAVGRCYGTRYSRPGQSSSRSRPRGSYGSAQACLVRGWYGLELIRPMLRASARSLTGSESKCLSASCGRPCTQSRIRCPTGWLPALRTRIWPASAPSQRSPRWPP